MLKVRHVLSVVCLLLFLGLPVAAQTERETVSPLAGFLERVWSLLSAPLEPVSAIWQADETESEDPDADPNPGSIGGWDPFG